MVLTECLLIYLNNQDSEKILKWVSEFFAPSPFVGILNYEMILPNDPFGQTMLNNLRDRGCDLLGIEGCPDANSQINRMNHCLNREGRTVQAECLAMDVIYREKLDPNEKARIEALEIFDEFEEWVLLQSHYCICFAKSFDGSQLGQSGSALPI